MTIIYSPIKYKQHLNRIQKFLDYLALNDVEFNGENLEVTIDTDCETFYIDDDNLDDHIHASLISSLNNFIEKGLTYPNHWVI